MTGPLRPGENPSQFPGNSPFMDPNNSQGFDYLGTGDIEDEPEFRPLRMLILAAGGLGILAFVILALTTFLAPSQPENSNGNGATPLPATSAEPIAGEQATDLIAVGGTRFTEAVAASNGVRVGITSNLFSTATAAPLQVEFAPQGDRIVYSLGLLAEPTPVRFARGGTAFINTVIPYPASTVAVAKIRDSEFVGEWALADPDDPTTQIPTLPEFANLLVGKLSNTQILTSAGAGDTQIVGDVSAILASEVPAGMLSRDIPQGAQASFLFDAQSVLVGVSLTSPEAREGDEAAPQVSYAAPIDGFLGVIIPETPSDAGVAPATLSNTGPWSTLVALATDIQLTAREVTQGVVTDTPLNEYGPEVAAAIQESTFLAPRLNAAQATFDPITSTLKDSAGRVVCLPLGIIEAQTVVAELQPEIYLDLCPISTPVEEAIPST